MLAGIAALSDPIAISVLPLVGWWMWFQKSRQGGKWILLGVAAAVAFVAVVSPWFVRNYREFGKIIPFRDNFGLELYVGNHGETWHWAAGPHPTYNDEEWQEYRQLGELRYMQHKWDQAMNFISYHEGLFVCLSLRRAIYMWTNYWSFDSRCLAEEPFDIPAVFLNTALSLLALWGLWAGWRRLGTSIAPNAIALFCFPIVYYVTHLEDYYRRPADPFYVVLATYAVTAFLQKRSERVSQPASLPQVV